MKGYHRSILGLCGLVVLALLLAACGGQTPAATAQPTEMMEPETHDEGEEPHGHIDPPAEFAGLSNPLADDPQAISAGADLYATSCAACHGAEGAGDGPAAAALDPPPMTFTSDHAMQEMSDGYLFWRITSGGAMEPFNSSMPAWGSTYSDDQIWQLVSFLRTLAK